MERKVTNEIRSEMPGWFSLSLIFFMMRLKSTPMATPIGVPPLAGDHQAVTNRRLETLSRAEKIGKDGAGARARASSTDEPISG